MFWYTLFIGSFSNSSARFKEFDDDLGVKVFARNIRDYASKVFHKSNYVP